MGPRLSRLDIESEALREERRQKSSNLEQRRTQHRTTASSMLARVLARSPESRQPWELALNPQAMGLLVKFLSPDLPQLLLVSATWHVRVLEALDQTFHRIESSFALVHSNLLFFKNSFQAFSRIRVADRTGLRHDRVIAFEPLSILCHQTVKLRCTYRFLYSSVSYRFEYKFDCVPNGKRTLWVYRDDSKFNGAEKSLGYHAQVPRVCVGHTAEIALTWFNLQGLLDLDSIEWQPPLIQDTRAVLQSLTVVNPHTPKQKPDSETDTLAHKLYHFNISRHCEAEYSNTEWFEAEYFARQRDVYIYDHFMPFLRLIHCEFAGVDVTTSKNTYLAVSPGLIPDSKQKVGMEIEVKERDSPITTEVKRLGLLYDRGRPLELRLGDTFILYISKGG